MAHWLNTVKRTMCKRYIRPFQYKPHFMLVFYIHKTMLFYSLLCCSIVRHKNSCVSLLCNSFPPNMQTRLWVIYFFLFSYQDLLLATTQSSQIYFDLNEMVHKNTKNKKLVTVQLRSLSFSLYHHTALWYKRLIWVKLSRISQVEIPKEIFY